MTASHTYQPKGRRSFMGVVLVFSALVVSLLGSGPARAFTVTQYDPYVDAVTSFSGVGLTSTDNVIGAPDGNSISLLGVGSSFTADMGLGEEGSGNFTLVVGALSVQALIRVELFDRQGTFLKSEDRLVSPNILGIGGNQVYTFNWQTYNQGYRYVKVSSLLGLGFGIDAIQAASYVGSDPNLDTDGDGYTDRQENELGLNPHKPEVPGES